MNTDQNTTRILCYGDSNTWGQKDDKSGRHSADIRWTGQLQRLLGEKYDLLEEGLSARTTNLDYQTKAGRNGATYLVPCLLSQRPLDGVILMLGTNDLKKEFHRSPQGVAEALSELVVLIKDLAMNANAKTPPILLVSPIFVDAGAKHFAALNGESFDEESAQKSHALATAIQTVAVKEGCGFFDASTVASPGEDGLHLNAEGHRDLATALAPEVRRLLPKE